MSSTEAEPSTPNKLSTNTLLTHKSTAPTSPHSNGRRVSFHGYSNDRAEVSIADDSKGEWAVDGDTTHPNGSMKEKKKEKKTRKQKKKEMNCQEQKEGEEGEENDDDDDEDDMEGQANPEEREGMDKLLLNSMMNPAAWQILLDASAADALIKSNGVDSSAHSDDEVKVNNEKQNQVRRQGEGRKNNKKIDDASSNSNEVIEMNPNSAKNGALWSDQLYSPLTSNKTEASGRDETSNEKTASTVSSPFSEHVTEQDRHMSNYSSGSSSRRMSFAESDGEHGNDFDNDDDLEYEYTDEIGEDMDSWAAGLEKVLKKNNLTRHKEMMPIDGESPSSKNLCSSAESTALSSSSWLHTLSNVALNTVRQVQKSTVQLRNSFCATYPQAFDLTERAFTSSFEIAHDVSAYWFEQFKQSKYLLARKLYNTMQEAQDYDEWCAAALLLDKLEGKTSWKMAHESIDYDSDLIYQRLEDFRSARKANDYCKMMSMLRAGLLRNLGGIGNEVLFSHTHVGTKKLIEQYIEEVVFQLNYIADTNVPNVTLKEKLTFFNETRHAFGRSALLLSGGGALGMYHSGVLKALYELQLLPRIVSGSSVGSIMAAVLCCTQEDELEEMLKPENVNIEAFELRGTKFSFFRKIVRLFQKGYLCEVKVLEDCIKSNIGDCTFQEAFNKTGRVLNITVNSPHRYEGPKLLNYLTSPNVIVYSAVVASCALSGLFAPVELMAKDVHGNIVPWHPPGSQWSDGSVESDLPMARLSELFNVNHFIVSQVNPHVAPFLHGESRIRKVLPKVQDMVVSEMRHRVNQLSLMGLNSKLVHNIQTVMSQKYRGDITIVPSIRKRDYLNIVSNPTPEYLMHSQKIGQLAAWQHVSIIRNHCEIELTLEAIVMRLREQMFMTQAKRASQEYADSSNANAGSSLEHLNDLGHDEFEPHFGQFTPSRSRTFNYSLSTTTDGI